MQVQIKLLLLSRMLSDCVEDASSAMCEDVKALGQMWMKRNRLHILN